MTRPSDGRATARLQHARELIEQSGPNTKRIYGHLLSASARDSDLAPYALISRRRGQQEVLLGHSVGELVALANQGLNATPKAKPVALVELDSGKRRDPVLTVFFAVEAMVLPLLVGNVLALDLRSRERDLRRSAEREQELRRAVALIGAGHAVPAELFVAIADVIELDLEDRRRDDERFADAEALLGEILDQLLLRAPARNYAVGAATGN